MQSVLWRIWMKRTTRAVAPILEGWGDYQPTIGKDASDMSTFVSTTLTKRTGATTTVFDPSGLDGSYGYFRASGSSALTGPSIRVEQKVKDSFRRTAVRLVIPQLDSEGRIMYRPAIDLSVYVPQGTASSDVNDMIGYMNALTATSLSNFDEILVDGIGLY